MYTIFINDAVIYLTDDHNYKDEISFVNYEDVEILMILEKLAKGVIKSIYLYHHNIDFLWGDFKKQFELIEAAGGVVFNEFKEVLWIHRNERWDLPKGKIEGNEDTTVAAIREVEEECGVRNVVLKEFIMTTYHIYQYKELHVLKVTHWYHMFVESNQKLKPQLEEGITKVLWLDKITMKEALKETYDNIKLLLAHLDK